ncbi:flagellar hook-basal body complex protein FliE [Nocardioides mangrovicus]|uniref:Flagellar hook-basal body complex protein FliE n=1 Tax=Nocardioides mangrovicus TaxID=2478913 RepID=A0A3L8P183_9ACTN|nr:flagellar hook-basal body complex protein FliE [Nocardioides mangrovicus]RLV48781.1 flagellar hook-basal body complex protein FliE [Nocardioides mangrovicus]
MSVSGVEAVSGFSPLATQQLSAASAVNGNNATTSLSGTSGTTGTSEASGSGFGDLVLDGIDRLESVQKNTDQLAVKAATGDLDAMHHYTIAATEAAVTTQLTVAVRNKALDAFNEIMRMPV